MKDKIEDIPGTPLKLIIKNNKFISLYIEKKGNHATVYTPFGSFRVEKKLKTKEGSEDRKNDGRIISPMAGKIIKVFKRENESVKEGEPLCVIEAMKMQNEIKASKSGNIIKANVKEGKIVKKGEILFLIQGDEG